MTLRQSLIRTLALIAIGSLLAVDMAQADQSEITFWESVKDSQDPAELDAYLKAFPNGKFAPLAKIRIKKLGGKESASPPTSNAVVAQNPEKKKSNIFVYLNLFGDVFEKLRTSYYKSTDDGELIRSAAEGLAAVYPADEAQRDLETALLKHSRTKKKNTSEKAYLYTFGDFIEAVKSKHADNFDAGKAIKAAIDKMLASLDPHNDLMEPADFKEAKVKSSGGFSGIGAEVTLDNTGLLKIVAPLDDSPAQRAGIQAGDLISAIDTAPVLGLTLPEAVNLLRGKTGTTVQLSVAKAGTTKLSDVSIVRGPIRMSYIKHRAEKDIGYIRVTYLAGSAAKDLRKAVATLEKQIGPSLKGFILDLRNCPGGRTDIAAKIVNDFLDHQGALYHLVARGLSQAQLVRATKGDVTNGSKIVALINGGTASGAEIIAGALADHKRATLVGTRTFGKGSLQTVVPLEHGYALRMTTAEFKTPAGRFIQAQGIEPDVVVDQVLPNELKGTHRAESELEKHLPARYGPAKKGSSNFVPKDRVKDSQLQYALRFLRSNTGPTDGNTSEQILQGKMKLEDLESLD